LIVLHRHPNTISHALKPPILSSIRHSKDGKKPVAGKTGPDDLDVSQRVGLFEFIPGLLWQSHLVSGAPLKLSAFR
jgi:hypothetical protein